MPRALLLLVVFAVAIPSASASIPARTGLYGLVTRGPIMPVCRIDEPCDEPASRVTIVFSRRGTSTRTTTGDDGRYRVRLKPGVYAVRTSRTGLGSYVEPQAARVPRTRFARVNLLIDTGIR